MKTFIPTPQDITASQKIVKAISEPIFQSVKATHDIYRATAKLEARAELAAELRRIPKPTKQVQDLIKKLETNV